MDFRSWILPRYAREKDFVDVPDHVFLAASSFCRLLRSTFGEYETSHVHIVPYSHVSPREAVHPHVVCVIYEMIYEGAESIHLGHRRYAREHAEMNRIEAQHEVMFECNTHWATSVWCQRSDHGT